MPDVGLACAVEVVEPTPDRAGLVRRDESSHAAAAGWNDLKDRIGFDLSGWARRRYTRHGARQHAIAVRRCRPRARVEAIGPYG